MASYPLIKDFSILQNMADTAMFLEQRIEYSGDNATYIGYSRVANAPTDQPIWFIVKLTYSGSNVTRVQLPDTGASFEYAWDDRATYFS